VILRKLPDGAAVGGAAIGRSPTPRYAKLKPETAGFVLSFLSNLESTRLLVGFRKTSLFQFLLGLSAGQDGTWDAVAWEIGRTGGHASLKE
jgi:hypothetical protein